MPLGVRTGQGLATAKRAGAAPHRNPWAKQPLELWPRSRERRARGFPPAPDLTPATRLLEFQNLYPASRNVVASLSPSRPSTMIPPITPPPTPYGLAPVMAAGGAPAPRAVSAQAHLLALYGRQFRRSEAGKSLGWPKSGGGRRGEVPAAGWRGRLGGLLGGPAHPRDPRHAVVQQR